MSHMSHLLQCHKRRCAKERPREKVRKLELFLSFLSSRMLHFTSVDNATPITGFLTEFSDIFLQSTFSVIPDSTFASPLSVFWGKLRHFLSTRCVEGRMFGRSRLSNKQVQITQPHQDNGNFLGPTSTTIATSQAATTTR